MSKLYDKYLEFKREDEGKYYLFKSGLFYIFIGDDAIKVSSQLGLKCTKLNDEISKCGFPINSLEKYMKKLEEAEITAVIIDNGEIVNFDKKYLNNLKVINFIKKIKDLDMNDVTPMESFNLLSEFNDVVRNE